MSNYSQRLGCLYCSQCRCTKAENISETMLAKIQLTTKIRWVWFTLLTNLNWFLNWNTFATLKCCSKTNRPQVTQRVYPILKHTWANKIKVLSLYVLFFVIQSIIYCVCVLQIELVYAILQSLEYQFWQSMIFCGLNLNSACQKYNWSLGWTFTALYTLIWLKPSIEIQSLRATGENTAMMEAGEFVGCNQYHSNIQK